MDRKVLVRVVERVGRSFTTETAVEDEIGGVARLATWVVWAI